MTGMAKPSNRPHAKAESIAMEYEAWACALRRFPEIADRGEVGSPEFSDALYAALDIMQGEEFGFDSELDELVREYGDDQDED
jgi:hypothetical protein